MRKTTRNKRTKKAAALLFALAFAVSVFAVTAFATEVPVTDPNTQTAPVEPTPDPVTPTPDPADPTVPGVTDPTLPVTDPNVPFDPNAPVTSPDGTDPNLPPVVDPNDPNASNPSSDPFNPDGTVSPPSGNEGEGDGLSSGESSESEKPVEPIEPETPVPSKKPVDNVQTDNAEINRNASKAAAAVSDPDMLSSQDWSELLTSGTVSGPSDGNVFNNVSGGNVRPGTSEEESEQEHSGGVSTALIAGIILIVLGLGGIGAFVYLQFFAGKRRDEDFVYDTGEITEFMDISSDSSGEQQREGYLPAQEDEDAEISDELFQRAVSNPVSDPTAETEAIPLDALPKEPAAPAPLEIAQPDVKFRGSITPEEASAPAEPVDENTPYSFKVEVMEDTKDKDGNFDWDSFFDN